MRCRTVKVANANKGRDGSRLNESHRKILQRMNRANLKSRVANGDDFRRSVLHAVDDAVISNKNLPYVVTEKLSYDSPGFWEID